VTIVLDSAARRFLYALAAGQQISGLKTASSVRRNDSRRRVEPNFLSVCVGVSLVFLAGCERIVYWQDLPRPSVTRVSSSPGERPSIKRAVDIARKLVDVKPVPASVVFVVTNEFRYEREKLPAIPDRAHAARCWLKGEEKRDGVPPSSACIFLPASHVDHLSDEALAAIIAHELGHIEKGHKTWEGAAEPTLMQWEADQAAIERLNLAGYCAGEL